MTNNRYHKAAKEGLVEAFKSISRKEANTKDEDSMTPVLWAAFEGHIDVLRLLCAKGGDPDKYDQFGNTALHLAAAKGHLRCVEFLVKFGVNIYSMDIDRHSAKDLAAINNRQDILQYLDAIAQQLENNDKKKSKNMRETAEKNCEKRIKEYLKRQNAARASESLPKGGGGGSSMSCIPSMSANQREQMTSPTSTLTATATGSQTQGRKSGRMLATLKQKIWSSQGNLYKASKDEDDDNQRTQSGESRRHSNGMSLNNDGKGCLLSNRNSFNAGTTSARGCNGHQTERVCDGSQTLASSNPNSNSNSNSNTAPTLQSMFTVQGSRGISNDRRSLCGSLSRSFSQPDILANETDATECSSDTYYQGFARDERGIRNAALTSNSSQISCSSRNVVNENLLYSEDNIDGLNMLATDSTSSSTLRPGGGNAKIRSYLNHSDTDSEGVGGGRRPPPFATVRDEEEEEIEGGDEDEEEDQENGDNELSEQMTGPDDPIHYFLTAWGLEEYLTIFQKQQIDLDTLMLLTESDLKSLGLPLGPFRRLAFAIQERRMAFANPGAMKETHL